MLNALFNPAKKGSKDVAYEFAYNFPQDLVRRWGRPSDQAMLESEQKPYLGGQDKFKKTTPMQPGHTDGQLSMSGPNPAWCSMLTPISSYAWLRYWPYSHDFTEALWNEQNGGELSQTLERAYGRENIFMRMKANFPSGCPAKLGNLIDPETLSFMRGECVLFLAHWLHAGACLPSNATGVNYRLHAYFKRPGAYLEDNEAVDVESAYYQVFKKVDEGDWDL